MSSDQSKLPVDAVKVSVELPGAQEVKKSVEVFLDRMDYEHWLVAGKQKGTGKSSLAIALVFWLKKHVEIFKNFKIYAPIHIFAEATDGSGYAQGYDPHKPNGYPHFNYHGNVNPVSYTHLTLPTICSV